MQTIRTYSSTRTQKKRAEAFKIEHDNACLLSLSALCSISALRISAFPEDHQKEARVLMKETAAKIRKIRTLLGERK